MSKLELNKIYEKLKNDGKVKYTFSNNYMGIHNVYNKLNEMADTDEIVPKKVAIFTVKLKRNYFIYNNKNYFISETRIMLLCKFLYNKSITVK